MPIEFKKIGIIGCGHLGLCLAESLLCHNAVGHDALYISHQGREQTLYQIESANLSSRLYDNTEIVQICDLIILTVKPQDLVNLTALSFAPTSSVVSFLAGVSIQTLRHALGIVNISRGIISSPDTIRKRQAIMAASQLFDDDLMKVLRRFVLYKCIGSEELINLMCVLATIPGLFLVAEQYNRADEISNAVNILYNLYKNDCKYLSQLVQWGHWVTPKTQSPKEHAQYISEMATSGGITETVISSFTSGLTVLQAFQAGIARCHQIDQEVSQLIKKQLACFQ